MAILVDRFTTVLLAATLILLTKGSSNKAFAQEVDLDTLCRKFPLNSRCKNYKAPTETEEEKSQDKNNDNNNEEDAKSAKVIKLNVSATGGAEEWVRIEKEGNHLKLLHTSPSESDFSEIANLITGFLPIPIPFPSFYT